METELPVSSATVPPVVTAPEQTVDEAAATAELAREKARSLRLATARRIRDEQPGAQPPAAFNPDPGAAQKPAVPPADPFFQRDHVALPAGPESE